MFGGVVSLSLSIVDDILSISYIVSCLLSGKQVVLVLHQGTEKFFCAIEYLLVLSVTLAEFNSGDLS
jgi:hypothetical protein